MSVRGSTGSRRLAKQGQTAGHAGEEAESSGSGRGSHQLGTPSPPLLHHKTPQLAVPGKAGRRAAGLGERKPPRAQDAVNSWGTERERELPPRGQCPPGIRPLGCRRLD